MKACRPSWRRLPFFSAVVALVLANRPAPAKVLYKVKDIAGTAVRYQIILPNDYDPAKTYPAVLAFPGGAQTMNEVRGTLERNWRGSAERLGYIVVIPAAPRGQLFFEEGAKVFPEFLIQLLGDFKVLDNKFHVAGVSNGGLSAFNVAASYPQFFWSVTGLPGFLLDPTPERVRALAKLCINMYAGEKDTRWLENERRQAEQFRAQGFDVQFSEENGQAHVMQTLEGQGALRLFAQFQKARHGCAN